MIGRREFLAAAAAASTQTLLPLSAIAQAKYPERPVRLVIPFPPGGVYDGVGRPWAEKMKAQLGTVVVENMGGAGGALGAAAVARAAADGYTLLLGGGGPLIINSVASSKANLPRPQELRCHRPDRADRTVDLHPSFGAGEEPSGADRLRPQPSRQAVLRLRGYRFDEPPRWRVVQEVNQTAGHRSRAL